MGLSSTNDGHCVSEGNSQHRAWTLLDDAVGCGTKDGQVQSIAAAHSEDDEVRIRFTGGADDLLVGLADAQAGLKEIAVPGGGWEQALELLYYLGRDRGEILVEREILHDVQQRQFGFVFLNQGERIE